jgi:hypothetical protein
LDAALFTAYYFGVSFPFSSTTNYISGPIKLNDTLVLSDHLIHAVSWFERLVLPGSLIDRIPTISPAYKYFQSLALDGSDKSGHDSIRYIPDSSGDATEGWYYSSALDHPSQGDLRFRFSYAHPLSDDSNDRATTRSSVIHVPLASSRAGRAANSKTDDTDMVTIVARQTGNRLSGYQTQSGDVIEHITLGAYTPEVRPCSVARSYRVAHSLSTD